MRTSLLTYRSDHQGGGSHDTAACMCDESQRGLRQIRAAAAFRVAAPAEVR